MDCNCKRDDKREELPVRYWKLTCPAHIQRKRARAIMEAKNVHCPKSASKTRVMQLLHRSERGLLSYNKVSTLELRSFIDARGLDGMSEHKGTGRRAMVKILEAADDNATFFFLMDLPPELRLRIFEQHLATFDTVDAQPPPLLQVSRTVRQEARPLFYDQCRLMIRIGFEQDERYITEDDEGCYPENIISRYGLCQALFDELDEDLLARIDRFTLYFRWNSTNFFDIDLRAETDEDMVKRAGFDHYLHCRAEPWGEDNDSEDREERIFGELLGIVKEIKGMEGKGKMKREHLGRFACNEMEGAFYAKAG